MKINIRESLGRLDLLTDNKYDLRNTYDSSNISNDKKKKLAESISNNASAKQIYNILNETFNEDGVNVTEKISDDVREGMFGGLIGKDTEWEVFFESGPTDILDSDMEDMANDISNGRLSGKTNNGVGWQIRVRYGDDFYDYNCLNCPENDYVGSRWEEYDESLTEASYGGAYDIEDDMFWTKDDLIEFSDAVCEKLADKFGYQYDIADVGAESNNDMYITIMDTTHDIEADVSFRIKMSRIRAPRDLMKYLDTVVSEFVKKFEEEYQYYEFDESLKEAVEDEIDVDEYEETDFNDGEVEEGDTFIEDGREWSWIERIAGPIHLDFDNWAVWSARDWDYIQEKIRPILLNKEELTVETLTKIYDEAEVAYFVVDEDTGFIDWGPVESQTEAQDFLNGKVEDWENDEYDESLQESKDLKEWRTVDLSYTDGEDEYTFEVNGEDVIDYITDTMYENGEYPDFLEGQSDEEIEAWLDDKENYPKFRAWVEEKFGELFKKYEDDILDYFREKAEMEHYDELDAYDDLKLNSWSRYDNGSGMTDKDFL